MGKCQKCKKDFQKGVKAAYKLGLLEGKNLRQIELNNARRANHHLFRELRYKDKVKPRNDCRVWFNRDFIERIERTLRRYPTLRYRADQLKKIIKQQTKVHINLEGFEDSLR